MFKGVHPRTPRCSSVWLVKRTALENNYDYKLSFFKRHATSAFGGFWATPGGFVDNQDDAEVWMKNYASFYEKFNHYPDLKLRIGGLRELYEEGSILPVYKDGSLQVLTDTVLGNPLTSTKDFATFGKTNNIFPAVDKLHGLIRTAPPHGSPLKRVDNQGYTYFVENDEDKKIKLNESELVDIKHLNPKEAFTMFYKDPKTFSLLFPQQIVLMKLCTSFSYDKLKDIGVNHFDKLKISYMQFCSIFFVNNEKLPNEDSEYKTLEEHYKNAFNEFDFLSDDERHGKYGLLNLNELLSLNDATQLKPVESYTSSSARSIFEHHKSEMMLLFPGDYFHTNEVYPWRQHRHSRHRAYISKGKMVRYEITKDVMLHMADKSSCGVKFGAQQSNSFA